jgi:para-nitrobenzyl esterase
LSKRVGGRAYLYQFTYVTPQGAELGLGSFHASEIAFVFNNLDRSKASAAEQQLAETMSTYWTTFARTGDPNAKGLPEWTAYDADVESAMEFATSARLAHHIRKQKLDLLESLLEKRRLAATK